MTILSIAICGKNCYIATQGFSKKIICRDIRDTSEIMLELLMDVSNKNFETFMFSSGPGSFTSVRVIGSIAKGIQLSLYGVKIISVSTFLTLFSTIPEKEKTGTIAIDTMRGDFYCMDFKELKLSNEQVTTASQLNTFNMFYDTNLIGNDINLAEQQIILLNSDKFIHNKQLVAHSTSVDYGTKPNYTF